MMISTGTVIMWARALFDKLTYKLWGKTVENIEQKAKKNVIYNSCALRNDCEHIDTKTYMRWTRI